MSILCKYLGHKVTYYGISSCFRDHNCERCGTVVKGMTIPPRPTAPMPYCKPPKTISDEDKLLKIQDLIDLAERWCDDQDNGMTDGSICISAMKDIRRILKEK